MTHLIWLDLSRGSSWIDYGSFMVMLEGEVTFKAASVWRRWISLICVDWVPT